MIRIAALMLLLFNLGCAQRAIVSPEHELAQSYAALGYEYLQLNEWAAARTAFREAIVLKPDLGQAYLGLALIFQRDGEVALAEVYYRHALHAEPQPAFAHALGQYLVSQDRLLEAAQMLQQATSDVDYLGRAMAFEDLAMLRLYQSEFAQARQAFSRAARLDELLPAPHWHLAQIALAQKEFAMAQTHYEDLEALIEMGLFEHSVQTLQLGVSLSEVQNNQPMQQRLLQQLEFIQLDQP